MAQHTINLPCIADTYVDGEFPNTNYGNSTQLLLGEKYQYQSYDYYKVALFKFNPSSLPLRKKIIKGELKLFVNSINIPEDGGSFMTTDTPDFNELTVKFNNQHLFSVVSRSLGGLLTNQYQTIEIKQLGGFRIKETCTYSVYASGNGNPYNAYVYVASRETANPPILVVTYEDVPPNAPTPTEPIGLYKDSRSIIRFAWNYNSDIGGTQKAFDLQWSADQSTWTTISETTANNYYDMPANTLPAGNIYWRVRCYNEYDEAGPYCDIQSFYAIGAPEAPTLNTVPTNTARPTITWAAFGQQVYQMQVLSGDDIAYDSGIVPGINIRSHKVTAWLADGDYTVQIRIKNEYDLWSEWGSAVVTISTVKPTTPGVTAVKTATGIKLTITDIDEGDYALIYRDDICIGKVISGIYNDNAVVNGTESTYFIRLVTEDETFTDSDFIEVTGEFKHSLIAPVSDLTNVFAFTRSLNTPPKRIYNRQPGGAFVEYAGRKSPVWEPTEHVSAGLSMAYFLKTWADVEAFTAIYDLNSTVLYKDSKGRKIYGTLSNLSVNDERGGYTVSFVLNKVDYNEELEV